MQQARVIAIMLQGQSVLAEPVPSHGSIDAKLWRR